jgi:dynein heavy chain
LKQEVTRLHKAQQWSLDEVEYATEVHKDVIPGDDGRYESSRVFPSIAEGCLIHGLYMEGAGWNKAEKRLEESQPKELFFAFPLIHVFAVSTAPVTGPGMAAKAKQDDRGGEK